VPSALAAIGQTSSAAALTVWNAVAREMAPDCFFRGFSLLANNLFLFCPLVGARKGNPLYNAPALTYHSAALPRPPSIRNLNATRFRVGLSPVGRRCRAWLSRSLSFYSSPEEVRRVDYHPLIPISGRAKQLGNMRLAACQKTKRLFRKL